MYNANERSVVQGEFTRLHIVPTARIYLGIFLSSLAAAAISELKVPSHFHLFLLFFILVIFLFNFNFII